MSMPSSTATASGLSHRPPAADWWPDWTGETVVIAASGPSQDQAALEYARGKARLIAVNRTWELCPWADVLYSAGGRFWETYRPAFEGMKVSGCDEWPGVYHQDAREWLPDDKTLHNSGAQAIIYAACWGASKIVLTGFDMQGRHWHADHRIGNPFTRYGDFITGLERLSREMRVPVLNASKETALRCFRRVTIEQALE